MHVMVDCAVVLNHSVVTGVSQRNLRVQKYRGTSFDENQSPFVIGKDGIEVGVARTLGRVDAKVTNERVSSGVGRLDTMLGGGYYRGACVLITGFPGTAKTTLSGAFAEAACGRGERTMFVSFDSDGSEVIRNLASVGIRLERHVKSGCLRMVSARTISGSAETFLVRIKTLAKEQRARCVVIDPVSTLSQSGNELTAHSVAERLFDWSKCDGTTLVCTSLLDEVSQESDSGHGSSLQISKIADTWIHLNYLMQAGERNRGISIGQVPRHVAFEPNARSDPQRRGRDSDRRVHRRRRGVNGLTALAKRKRRSCDERDRRTCWESQARQTQRRGG